MSSQTTVASDSKSKIVREFPWGICFGEISGLPQTSKNAFLSTSPGGMLVKFDSFHQNLAANVVETCALSIVHALPPRSIEVHVIDFAIRKRFKHLSRLASIKEYRIHDNKAAATKVIEDIESLARYRHHELLNDITPTLSDYNKVSRGFERYRLLMINLNDFPGDEVKNRERLLYLLDAAFDAGIYVLFYINSDLIEAKDERQNAPVPFFTLLTHRYPQLMMQSGDTSGFVLLPDMHTLSLLHAVSESGGTITPPQLQLDAISQNRLDLAASNEGESRDFLSVPVGETFDGRQDVFFNMGERSDCNNAFILGISGSGKTTFLNNLIVGIAERYTSDELRLFLMDYKSGVEFQSFAQHPNCEKIFLDNKDINAARQLLEAFQGAINDRSELFRTESVKDIDGYNAKVSLRLPRLLLIIDEVQCLFTSDNNGRQCQDLLKDVTRRGRAFGVHIILSTVTLINTNVEKDLMTQIALRVAFKLNSERDCELILDLNNTLPRHLNKYEFIVNSDSGYREANVRVRGLEPPNIAERIAAVRAQLPAGLALTPEIVKSNKDARVADLSAESSNGSSWESDIRSEEIDTKTQFQQSILAQAKELQEKMWQAS